MPLSDLDLTFVETADYANPDGLDPAELIKFIHQKIRKEYFEKRLDDGMSIPPHPFRDFPDAVEARIEHHDW